MLRRGSEYLLRLLENQRTRGLVTDLRRAKELDRTGVDEARRRSPLLAMSSEVGEGLTLEVYESLLDHRLHLAMTTLHVHHHRRGDTTSDPFVSRSGEVLYGAHVACDAGGDEAGSRTTEGIAVVRIEVRGHRATTFVAEEVGEGGELTRVATFFLPLSELRADHLS